MTTLPVEDDINRRPICSQAGFLPVPLRSVPAKGLAGLKIYIAGNGQYSLYSSLDVEFSSQDSQRLLDNGTEFVYVSVSDHQAYYKTMEKALENIVADPHIQQEQKSQILYATSIELSNQLLAAPPGKEEIHRAANLAKSTVKMILKDHKAFGRLYEAFNHDFYTATHLVNVCGLTITLALKMGLADESILQQIGTGGLLHDIGKIFIPSDLLNTPKKLTAEEYEIVKTHVDRGCHHLANVMDLPDEMLAIMAEHHERMDGSGYPKGLRHDQISPLGRLAGIVDTFDAMTSVRPYRSETYSMAEALEHLEREAPDKFDVEIVHAFSSLIEHAVQVGRNVDAKNGKSSAGVRLSSSDVSGAKHTQYYFRIPVIIRRIGRVRGSLTMGAEEKATAHKISCVGMGFLSDQPFDLHENIFILSEKLKSIGLDKLLAVVTKCQNQTGGWFTVDAQFQQLLSADVVDRIKTVTATREISSLSKQ